MRRALIAGSLALLMIAQSGSSAQASTTVTVGATAPQLGNCAPFGRGIDWTPYLGFVYKNIPAFQLKTGDTVAFDLGVANDVNVQLSIDMTPTLTNGGAMADQPAAPFTNIVGNTQLPANPLGNNVVGDYELAFKAEAPFSFNGGGLIIRFSNPSAAFVGDTSCTSGHGAGGGPADSSGFFVERFYSDADGAFPWDGVTATTADPIAQFGLILADASTATTSEDPKCKKLRKKLRRQRRNLANQLGAEKRSQIRPHVEDTKNRLKRLGCSVLGGNR